MLGCRNVSNLCQLACIIYIAVAVGPSSTTDELLEEIAALRYQIAESRRLSGHEHAASPTAHLELGAGSTANETAGGSPEHHGEHGGHGIHLDHCMRAHDTGNVTCTLRQHAEIIDKLMPQLFFAFAVMMFLVVTMGLLAITKWKDADVRMSVYSMISTTVSIFCAILINNTIFNLFALQIIPCPPPRGFGKTDPHHHSEPGEVCGRAPPMLMIVVFVILYSLYTVVAQVIITNSRPRGCLHHGQKKGYVATNLGAHLRGFAAIGVFGMLQYENTNHVVMQALLVVLLAWVFFIVVRCADYYAPWCGRKALLLKDAEYESEGEDEYSRLRTPRTAEDIISDHEPKWSEQMKEIEDESSALCLGYLLVQALCLGVLGHKNLPPVEEEEFHIITVSERNLFFKWELGILGLFIVIVMWRSLCSHHISRLHEHSNLLDWQRHAKALQTVVGMTFSWLMFRHFDWFYREILNDLFNPFPIHRHPPQAVHLMARIINASFWSVISCVAVIVLDLVADAYDTSDCRQAWSGFVSAVNPGCPGWGEPRSSEKILFDIAEEKKRELENEERPNPFREIIGILGFLVGVCWEKAFSEANAMFTENFFELMHHVDKQQFEKEHHSLGPYLYFFAQHPMVTSTAVSTLIVTIVFLTWVKYLVPYAQLCSGGHITLAYTERFICEKMEAAIEKKRDLHKKNDKYLLMFEILEKQAMFKCQEWECRECKHSQTPTLGCPKCKKIKDRVELTKAALKNDDLNGVPNSARSSNSDATDEDDG